MIGPDLAVIGGGLSGVAAALTAAEAGASVILLEQRPHLGGLASSFHLQGVELDYGQHVFLRCCTAYRSFVDRIGGAEHLELQERLAVPVFNGDVRPAWVRRGLLPAPLHLARSILLYRHLSFRERLAVPKAIRALKGLDICDESLDGSTFASWLQREGQTDRAVERFWDLIGLPTLNLPAGQVSLLAAARTFHMGLLSDARAADVGWARVPLSRLHHDLAGTALAGTGVTVRLRTKVQAIDVADAGGLRLSLSDGSSLEPRAVISAVPPRSLGTLFTGGRLAGDPPWKSTGRAAGAPLGAGLGHSPIINVHFWFDRRVMPFVLAAGVGDLPLWVFDRSTSAKHGPDQYLVASLSAADGLMNCSNEEIAASTLNALGRFLPEIERRRPRRWLVIKEAHATIGLRPGTDRLRAKAEESGTEGIFGTLPIFVAGAWTDTGWPPTMESAIRSGTHAAEIAVKKSLKREGS